MLKVETAVAAVKEEKYTNTHARTHTHTHTHTFTHTHTHTHTHEYMKMLQVETAVAAVKEEKDELLRALEAELLHLQRENGKNVVQVLICVWI